jgi:hypothetical protein
MSEKPKETKALKALNEGHTKGGQRDKPRRPISQTQPPPAPKPKPKGK